MKQFFVLLVLGMLAFSHCQFLTTLKCSSNQFNQGGVCQNCDQVYDAFCTKCNDQTCTECQGSAAQTQYIAQDGSCQGCDGYFGTNCKTCTSTECLNCQGVSNSTAFIGYDGKCYTCKYVEEQCDTCNVEQCLTCEAGWVLEGRNCEPDYHHIKKIELFDVVSDKCKADQYEQNGQCFNCNETFGENCSGCSSTECTTCDGQDKGTAFIGYNGVCYTCDYVEDSCLTCDVDECLSCKDGWTLVGRNCEPSHEISFQSEKANCSDNQYEQNGFCYNCDQTFDAFCTKCTFEKCTECQGTKDKTQYIGQDGACYGCSGYFGVGCSTCDTVCLTCSGTENQTSFIGYDGKCYDCSYVEEQCDTCDVDECLTCKDGWTLVGRNCEPDHVISFQQEKKANCSDNQYEQNGFCYNCDQTFDAFCTKCTFEKCTECQGTKDKTQYIGQDGACYGCSGYFGVGCSTCDTVCLTCSGTDKQTSFIGYDGKCYDCTFVEEQCDTCSVDECLTCKAGFKLVGRNCVPGY